MNLRDYFSRSKEHFLSKKECLTIVQAIVANEKITSGEIRLCIEAKCNYVDPLLRAEELFHQLKMQKTEKRNAVIIYIAYQDKEFALYGDVGFDQLIKDSFWTEQSALLRNLFKKRKFEQGIINSISNIGKTLGEHFPYEAGKKNELPDEIVFA